MSGADWLILGSNSFSGASLADHLSRQGESVIATSRSEEVALPFRPYGWEAGGGREAVRFVKIDLNHDLETLDALLKAEQPKYIVNFAAQSMVGESWEHPTHWMQTNVVGITALLEVLRTYNKLERYVHVTTPEVYGSTSGWVNEAAPFNPSTPYAVSRAAGDMVVDLWQRTYDLPVVATRAANVYGPGQQLYRIIPRTVFFALTGRRLQLHGGGYSERSFIHMDDVSDATRKITEKGRNGQTYHISTTRQISIRDLVNMTINQLGRKFEDGVEEVGERMGKDSSYMLDSSRLRDELGWADAVSVEAGVESVIAWVRDHLDDLADLPHKYIHKP